jgi:hypothetical protein
MAVVYRILGAQEGYQYLVPSDEQSAVMLCELRGHKHTTATAINCALVTADPSEVRLQKSDLLYMYPHLLCVEEARLAEMAWIPDSCGEWVELHSSAGQYYGLHCTRLIDALDMNFSDVDRFTNGKLMQIRRYTFLSRLIERELLFRLQSNPMLDLYCTDTFVSMAASFTSGLHLKQVWTNE